MNDASNRAAPNSDTLNGSSETLSRLHALIERVGGLKKWSPDTAKAAEELLAKVVFSEVSDSKEQGSALSLAQDLPIPVIESVFEKHWPAFSEDRKAGVISELMKLNSDRSVTRQVAVAQKIAQFDKLSAAYILQELMVGFKKGKTENFWPELSKEKKELIRGRFGTREWVYFNLSDERAMRSLLAGFVEALTEAQPGKVNKKTQRCTYDFARWALSTLRRVGVDDVIRQLVKERVMRIAQAFPIEWKKELDAIASDMPTNGSPKSGTNDSPIRDTDSSIQTTTSFPVAPSPDALPSELTTHSVALALIERKRAEVAQRRTSVELLQNDITLVEDEVDLIQKLLHEAEIAQGSNVELQQARLEIDGLKSAISRLESDLASSRSAHQSARERSGSLSIRNEELERALEQERTARAAERRELEEEAERLIGIKLDGFKSRLAKSLDPIFRNKRKTDDQEPTSRLSEFLRSWFDEIDDHLKKLGVHLSKDL